MKILKNSSLSAGQKAVNYARRDYQLTSVLASESNEVKLKPLKDVPGPKTYPIIGSLIEYRKHEKKQHLWFQELQKTHGDVVKINMGFGEETIHLYSPENAQKMYASDGHMPNKEMHPFNYFIWYRNVREKERYPDGNAGLAGSFLEIWREQRTAVNQDTMRKKAALYYLEDTDKICNDCIDRIAETRDEKNDVKNAVPDFIYRFSLEEMCKIFLDKRMGALDPGARCTIFVKKTHEMNIGMNEMSKSGPFWKYFNTKGYKKFDDACTYHYNDITNDIKEAFQRIKDTKQDYDKPRDNWSLLHKMVDRFGEDSTIPVVMATDMILGGVDTTSFTGAAFLYNLACNPIKQEKAIEEVDRLFGGGKLNAEGFSQLRYVRACMLESQRLSPVTAGTVRILSNPIAVDGYLIPKGQKVFQSQYVIGHDPRNFTDPERYLPERWLRGHPDQTDAHTFSNIPFGYGPRICVGKRYAEMAVQALMVKMLQRFRMEYHHEPVGLENHLINVADRDMRIRLIERT